MNFRTAIDFPGNPDISTIGNKFCCWDRALPKT